jgi:hypothetical protein
MLSVFLRIFEMRSNQLNLLSIFVYSQEIKIYYYFRELEQLAT